MGKNSNSIKLTKAQAQFFKCKEKEAACVSGLGGGKSFILMLSFIVNEILDYPDALHCFVALSNQQLRDVSMPTFESMCEQFNIKFELNRTSGTYTVNGKTRVMFRSLDVSDRMRSVEIGSLYIEEFSFGKKYDIETFMGRLRDSKGSLRIRTAFTPNGFNFAHDYWVKGNRTIIRMSTFDNKHLPQSYIEALTKSYDSQLQLQELHGEFLNMNANQTYYMFDRLKQAKEFEIQQQATHFGMDFNVNPLTGTCVYMQDDIIYVTDEMFLLNSNTFEAVNYMNKIWGAMSVVPDSTGNSRKTSSSKTDHQIIKDAGFTLVKQHNPSVKDRYNCVNNLLEKGRLIIHSRCTNLINDLEKMCDNNKDPMVSHISDALGYVCWHLAPMRAERKKSACVVL